MSFVKKKPVKEKDKEAKLELNPRLKAIVAEAEALDYNYILSANERRELIFEQYKQKYKGKTNERTGQDAYQYDIQKLYKIKHPNGKVFYTYRILEEVTDNANGVHTFARLVGWHNSPLSEKRYDEFDNPKPTDIINWRITYELDWNQKEIEDLIKGSRSNPTQLAVGIGVINGKDKRFHNNPFSVFNLKEWFDYSVDDLMGASNAGYLTTEYGGCQEYLNARGEKIANITKERTEQLARVNPRKSP